MNTEIYNITYTGKKISSMHEKKLHSQIIWGSWIQSEQFIYNKKMRDDEKLSFRWNQLDIAPKYSVVCFHICSFCIMKWRTKNAHGMLIDTIQLMH